MYNHSDMHQHLSSESVTKSDKLKALALCMLAHYELTSRFHLASARRQGVSMQHSDEKMPGHSSNANVDAFPRRSLLGVGLVAASAPRPSAAFEKRKFPINNYQVYAERLDYRSKFDGGYQDPNSDRTINISCKLWLRPYNNKGLVLVKIYDKAPYYGKPTQETLGLVNIDGSLISLDLDYNGRKGNGIQRGLKEIDVTGVKASLEIQPDRSRGLRFKDDNTYWLQTSEPFDYVAVQRGIPLRQSTPNAER